MTPAVEGREAGLTPPPGLDGLSSDEARRLLVEHGANALVPERHRTGMASTLVRAATDPMALLLLVAGPTYLLLRDVSDAAITFAALVPIVAVGLVLEVRAERALEGLKRLTAPTATVWRDGRRQTVPTLEIVPGDLVFLQEGDVIPADGDFAAGTQVMVDESALTGESVPVGKAVGGSEGERTVLAGTTVLSGRGMFRVTVTGAATGYGRIGTLVAGIKEQPTPLQRLIGRLVRRLGLVALAFCVAVIGIQLSYGKGWGAAVIAGVSLAIAAIPEEFPMVFTLYLALGAWRLARERALVRRLAGVETLGATSVICSDKTGTLTLGRLEVAGLTGPGEEPILADDGPPGDLGTWGRSLLESAVLASEPLPFDPLEQAIVRFASANGVDVDALHARRFVHDYAFDPATKRVTHVWAADGGSEVFAKGAIEGILEVCGAHEDVRREALSANHELASRGMRVIAVASGPLPEPTGDRDRDERALRFDGLVALSDPPRPGVAEALAECRQAGIRVVMITGDHPMTAHAVAEHLGLPDDGDRIVTGDDLDAASDEELDAIVARANVFSRTRPEQKHRLVEALKRQGHVVAMTGDGINDAPALRESDIGVAMGQRGTEVAREAATMVLLDDNFATIVGAVRDGRRIFENLRRAFAFLIAFHVPLLLGALVVPLTGTPLLLLPVHLVLLELILHPTISLVFEADPAAPDLMRRRPRPSTSGLLGRRDLVGATALGLTLAAAVLAVYLVRIHQGVPVNEARALAFTTMVLGQLFLVFVGRSPELPVWRASYRDNRALPWIAVGTLLVVFAADDLPGVAEVMRLAPLSLAQFGLALLVAAAATLWLEPFKRRTAA